jgi:SAM-dependent methyltransferase
VSTMAKRVMRRFYRQSRGVAERLPWHREEPSPVLVSAVKARDRHGRALDVGCGAGVFSAWLAKQGMDTTGLDLFPEAIAMAEKRAAEEGVDVAFVRGDLFAYAPQSPFDLVFDSGCLHSLVGGSVTAYREQLLRWLAPGGDFVLEHWATRHRLDWRPVGPRRRSQATIQRIFAPDLRLVDTHVSDFRAPLPFGPNVRAAGYHFRGPTTTTASATPRSA